MKSEKHSTITESDIWYILENTWEKSKGEWLLATEGERKETLQFIKMRLESTRPDGFSKLWKTDKKEPIALLGAYRAGDKRYETFLICSRHMEQHALKLSFEMRRLLQEHATQYKGCSMGQYADPNNAAQISWFRFFGFKRQPEGDRGNTQYYEYASKA